MKKFISTLTSVALTATALSSVLALNTSAVDSTIFDIRSDGKNAVTVSSADIAKGDVEVPVSVFLPQCQGVNNISLKFTVNGDATLGKNPGNFEHLLYNYVDDDGDGRPDVAKVRETPGDDTSPMVDAYIK